MTDDSYEPYRPPITLWVAFWVCIGPLLMGAFLTAMEIGCEILGMAVAYVLLPAFFAPSLLLVSLLTDSTGYLLPFVIAQVLGYAALGYYCSRYRSDSDLPGKQVALVHLALSPFAMYFWYYWINANFMKGFDIPLGP